MQVDIGGAPKTLKPRCHQWKTFICSTFEVEQEIRDLNFNNSAACRQQ